MALGFVLGQLPPEFPAPILVVQHLSERSVYLILEHLAQRSKLPVSIAVSGEPLAPGRVYLAPPDRHLLVAAGDRLQLLDGPRVKFCRPAAEPLFTSVAGTYRERALGLVLSGCNTDGAAGTQAIKWMGGRVLAQDPATARAAGMPRAAIATGLVDHVVPLDRIPHALVALTMAPGVAEYLKVSAAAA